MSKTFYFRTLSESDSEMGSIYNNGNSPNGGNFLGSTGLWATKMEIEGGVDCGLVNHCVNPFAIDGCFISRV